MEPMNEGVSTCRACSKMFTANEDVLFCSANEAHAFHPSCIKLPIHIFRKMSKSNKENWKCLDCLGNTSTKPPSKPDSQISLADSENDILISSFEKMIKTNLEKNNDLIFSQLYNMFSDTLKLVIKKESSNFLANYLDQIDNQFKSLHTILQKVNENLININAKIDKVMAGNSTLLNKYNNINFDTEKINNNIFDNNQKINDIKTELKKTNENYLKVLLESVHGPNISNAEQQDNSYAKAVKCGLPNEEVIVNKKTIDNSLNKSEINNKNVAKNKVIMEKISERNTTDNFLNVVKNFNDFEKIFISRLDPVTTEKQIEEYIQSKFTNKISIRIYKCRTKYPTYSSFCLSVPKKEIDRLLNREFWPNNMVIRRFHSMPSENYGNKEKESYVELINDNLNSEKPTPKSNLTPSQKNPVSIS